MEVNVAIFEKLLTNNDLKKRDFANYSKIPYSTVTGWKKKNHVPAYVMVILKDMIYRKKIDLETMRDLKKIDVVHNISYSLTADEEKTLKSVFWGTNYTLDDIVQKVKTNNQRAIKRIKENIPLSEQKQIMNKLVHA